MASGPLTVKIQINADGSAAIVGINKVKGALAGTGQQAKEASGGIKALSSSFQSLALTAGAALSVGALASSFTSANRQAGLLRASLETVTGSVAKATTAWEVLQGFAAKTPYSLEQAVQGFIKLKSMGLDPSMAALTSYGNTAGAMGKSLNQMIEAVADAATGEFERLKEFGIKAKVEGDSVALTFQGVTTTIGNNAQAIEQYLLNIGNVQFAGGMARQAKTLEGAVSNLGDAWDQFWVGLGDTGLTQGVITVLNDVSSGLASLGEGLTGANGVASTFGSTMASLGEVVATTYNDLKTGAWSETTTAIMATAGAIGGAIGLMTALSAAVGIATGVWGAFTAILLANPVTLAIAGIGALIGVLYTLRDETVTIGQTTTTVGATVAAAWETTASYSQSVWETFAAYVSGEFNRLPPAVSSAGSAILSVWSAVMTNLQSIASGAINYVANLFTWLGRSAGVLAGEVAMAFESGFSFDRLKQGLSGAVEYTDRVGAASEAAASGIAAMSQEIAKKADNIRAVNQVESDYAELERELAADNAKAALAAKLHAFEQNNLSDNIKRGTKEAKDGANVTGAGGKAHGGAAKAVNDHAKAMDDLIKRVMPARDDTEQLAEATAILADKMAKGELSAAEYAASVGKLEKELLRSTQASQALIDEYDREGAQARKLAEDSDRLQAIIAKGGEQAERAKIALENLGKQQAKNSQEADAWTEVWKNAVKRIDDTFANLWEDLFSGGKSALASLKRAITSWLAEVAHALITKPLVVAITAGMTGGGGTAGATGMTGGGGAAGGVTSGLSGLSSFSSIGSMFSTAFSLGGYFLEGVYSGFASIFAGTAGSALSAGAAGVASGSSAGIAAGAGVLAVYALPVIIAAAAIFAKYQKDQKPRVGAFAATTHGGVGQLEDSIGVAGGFGLTFGVNDKGSANIDAEEMREAFEGFAKVSLALEQFYGADLAAEVEATLKQISNEHYARTGILNYAMDMNEAFDVAFTQIIDAAAATGDSVAVVMKAVVGDLQGTTENMANQIETAMQTTSAVIQVAKAMEGTDAAKILELGDDLTANALRLVDYARSLQWTGEELSATLGRMGLYLSGLDTALQLTGTQTEATGQDFIDLARNLAYAADEAKIGMEGLIQLQNSYYEHFFTEEERALKQKEDAYKAINAWNWEAGNHGDAAITSSAAFRKYVESLDLTTEAGRAAYVEAMKISLAFIAMDEALDKLGDTVIDVTDKFAAQRKSLRDLADRLDPTDPLSQEQRDSALDALRKAGYKGSLYDAQGLADFLRTLADLEDAGGKAGEDLQKFIDTFTGVFDELARIAEERSGLEMRLLELTGTKTQILAEKRRLEIEATDESNRALLRYIHTLEDAAAAAAEMASLTERLYAAAGDDAMVTQIQRQAELAEALSDGARAMLLMIYAIEDSAAAAEAANKQAEEAAQAANDAARAAFDANQEATRKQADAVQELISTLQSLRDALKSAIEAIFIETPLTRVSTRDEAQEQITAALVAARGGVMPDLEKLSPYLDVVSQNAESQFRTLEEYQRDAYRTRAQLVELEALIGDRQTVEEQTLEALNTIINESFPESDANADQNADKIVVDVQRLIAVANAINEGVLRMDTDMDGLITFAEMQTALAGLATDPELRALFDMLDVNGDGILSALEALPLKIAQNMTGLFDMLDTNLDGLLTFDELKAGLGPLATDEQVRALIALMDTNHDGVISELEALRYQIISDSNILFAKLDLNGDKALTQEEFMAGLAGIVSKELLISFWNALDINHDGLLDSVEAIPLRIATNLSGYFNALDTNTDRLLTFDELKAGLGGMATDDQLRALILAVDANGDGMISEQEAATFKLGDLNTTATASKAYLTWLESINNASWQTRDRLDTINSATTTGNSYLSSINNAVWQIKDQLTTSNTHLADIRVSDYNSRLNLKRIVDFGTAVGGGYATGGIAEGPLSGYGATLHGREAVIPLGDGNKVVATLREPANYLPGVPDSAGLRAALEELQAELRAMRRDQQTIGATTAGELKEHNRRERKRDVVPQQVEVIS